LPDELDEFFDSSMYSNTTIFLIKPIEKILSDLPVRIINCLRASDLNYVLDMVENWEDMKYFRNFGKKSYMILDDYLISHGIDRSKITKEEKILAKQLIKRKAEVKP
jgi:DNA-directed RNA polymerase alpha subunit